MNKLLLLVVLLAGGVVVAEVAAPPFVAARAESAIAAETEGRVTVDVDVSGPPLIIPILLDGTVASFDMHLREVTGRSLPVDVRLEFDDVQLSRRAMLRGEVHITDVGRGAAVVVADLSTSVPEPLRPFVDRLGDVGIDRLLDELGNSFAEASANALVVGGLDIPVVSCTSEVSDLVVTTTCELDRIPPFVVRTLQRG